MTDKELARLEFAKNSLHDRPQDKIHESVTIEQSARIGKDGFGFARDVDGTLVKVNHAGNVVIEKNVEIRAFVTVDRAVNGNTIIGQGTKIDHHCHIAHNVKIGKWNTLANGTVIEGSCEVGDFNTFGANVVVQRKVKIGSNCKFGSGAVVTKDVPDNSIMVGNPARKLEKKNVIWPIVEPMTVTVTEPSLKEWVNRVNEDIEKPVTPEKLVEHWGKWTGQENQTHDDLAL